MKQPLAIWGVVFKGFEGDLVQGGKAAFRAGGAWGLIVLVCTNTHLMQLSAQRGLYRDLHQVVLRATVALIYIYIIYIYICIYMYIVYTTYTIYMHVMQYAYKKSILYSNICIYICYAYIYLWINYIYIKTSLHMARFGFCSSSKARSVLYN